MLKKIQTYRPNSKKKSLNAFVQDTKKKMCVYLGIIFLFIPLVCDILDFDFFFLIQNWREIQILSKKSFCFVLCFLNPRKRRWRQRSNRLSFSSTPKKCRRRYLGSLMIMNQSGGKKKKKADYFQLIQSVSPFFLVRSCVFSFYLYIFFFMPSLRWAPATCHFYYPTYFPFPLSIDIFF